MINYGEIFDNEGLSYLSYRDLIDNLLVQGKTTGSDDSDAMLHYTKMNVQRMRRLDKTIHLSESLMETIRMFKNKFRFLVISEGWCGDAAQIVPVFNKIAQDFSDHVELKLVLRDQNLEMIDAHLTNGGRAIPVLLILDNEGRVVLSWGPRPAVLQSLILSWKVETTDMMALAERLHGWYAKNKTRAIQDELVLLLRQLTV